MGLLVFFLGLCAKAQITDTTAPSITLNIPTTNKHFSATDLFTSISGTASDNVDVTQVGIGLTRIGHDATGTEFWSGTDGIHGTDWLTPGASTKLYATLGDPDVNGVRAWSFTGVPTGTNFPPGRYSLTVTAWDAANNYKNATAIIYFGTDTTPPALTVSPTNNAEISGISTASGTVTDASGVERVSVQLNRMWSGTMEYWNPSGGGNWTTTSTTMWATVTPTTNLTTDPERTDATWSVSSGWPTTMDAGRYMLKVVAYDRTENVTTISNVLKVGPVDTKVPEVTISTPTADQLLTGMPATVTGTAKDAYDTVAGVPASGLGRVQVQLMRSWNGTTNEVYTNTNNPTDSSPNWGSSGPMTYATVTGPDGGGNYTWSATIAGVSSATFPPGRYFYKATAIDRYSNSASANQFVNIGTATDTTAPTATVTTPANSSNISRITSLAGTATDNTGGSGLSRMNVQLIRWLPAGGGTTTKQYWNGTAWSTTSSTFGHPLPSSPTGTFNWSITSGLPTGSNLVACQHQVFCWATDRYLNNSSNVLSTFNVVANTAPSATGQTLSTAYQTALPLTLSGTDTEGDAMTFAVATGPSHGSLSGTSPNLTYTPASSYSGADSFTFTASDYGITGSAATVNITVGIPPLAAPGVPTFGQVSGSTVLVFAPVLPAEATSLSLQRKLSTDPDGNYQTIATGLPANEITIAKDLTEATEYTFRYSATDGTRVSSGTGASVATTTGGAPNDNFVNAQTLTGATGTVYGENVDATLETGEPAHFTEEAGGSIWYKWTAPTDELESFSTAGSGLSDTVMAVYTGTTLASLDQLGSNEHGEIGGSGSEIRIQATAGTTYYIAVDGDYETGAIKLTWSPFTRPSNDNFADAQVLSPAGGSLTTDNKSATTEPGEPKRMWRGGEDGLQHSSDGETLWYSYTPTSDGWAKFSTSGSAVNTVLTAYTGTALNSLTLAAVNDNERDRQTSLLAFPVTHGVTYYIWLDTRSGAGPVDLSWAPLSPPANDNIANAIAGFSDWRIEGENYGATAETGEPHHAGATPTASVWYKWTPTTALGMQLQADAVELMHPRIAVYTSDNPEHPTGAGLTLVPNYNTSPLYSYQFYGVPGTTYFIAIDGLANGADFSTQFGQFNLAYSISPFDNHPPTPAAPAAPTFSDVTATSLKVHLPVLPDRANSMNLQRAELPGTAPSRSSVPTTGLLGWYRTDSVSFTTSNTTISHWADSSGQGRHAWQDVLSEQPAWSASAIAGRPGLNFGGVDFLRLPSILLDPSAGLSVFAVARPTGRFARKTPLLISLSGPDGADAIQLNPALDSEALEFRGGGDPILSADAAAPNGEVHEFSAILQAGTPGDITTGALARDGITVAGPTDTFLPASVSRSASGIGDGFVGDISEVLIYSRALGETDQQAVDAYLKHKYASGLTIPGDLDWTTVATGLGANAVYSDSGLSAQHIYVYRAVGVNPDKATPGTPAEVSTLEASSAAPDAPGAPIFSSITATSLRVTAPDLPDGAAWLRLQRKKSGEADSAYVDVQDGMAASDVSFDQALDAEQEYTYRFVSIGDGVSTPGTAANVTTTSLPALGTGTGLRGKYYNAKNTGLAPVFLNLGLERIDPFVDFDWESGSPGPTVIRNGFSATWTGEVEPRYTELYTFKVSGQSYAKLFLDDVSVTGDGYGMPAQSNSMLLEAGHRYKIRLEFGDVIAAEPRLRFASCHLTWSSPTILRTHPGGEVIPTTQLYPAAAVSGHGLWGQYYDGYYFTDHRFSRVDKQTEFDWGTGSPAASITPDPFSVFWHGEIEVEEGDYVFSSHDISGAYQIRVEESPGVWKTTHNFGPFESGPAETVTLSAGRHKISIQFVDVKSRAYFNLVWKHPSGTDAQVPQEWLYPDDSDTTPPPLPVDAGPKPDAECVQYEVPTEMEAGKTYLVHVKMRNKGSYVANDAIYNLWNSSYHLNALWLGNTTWGITATSAQSITSPAVDDVVTLPTGPGTTADVTISGTQADGGLAFTHPDDPDAEFSPPEQTLDFTFSISAPKTPGIYACRWQLADGGHFADGFGDPTSSVSINVVAAGPQLKVVKTTSASVELQMPNEPTGATGLTLQRAADPEADPPVTDGQVLWLRGDELTGLAPGASVTQWPGAGTLPAASQETAENQPIFVPLAQNGFPALHFDGTSRYLTLPGGFSDWGGGASIFVVARPEGNSASQGILNFGNGGGTDSIALDRAGNRPDAVYTVRNGDTVAAQVTGVNGLDGDGFRILSATQGPSTGVPAVFPVPVLNLDGQSISFGASASDLPAETERDVNYIGASALAGTGAFKGDIAEIIVYNRELSPTERAGVERYLSRKFGVNAPPSGLSWTNVATGLDSLEHRVDDGLDPDTQYWYRAVVDGSTDTYSGPVPARTLKQAPAAPPAPDFTDASTTTITLDLPGLPARAVSLALQRKLSGEDDVNYTKVRKDLVKPSEDPVSITVDGLAQGKTYTFRWVAVGEGGETAGTPGDYSTTTAEAAPDKPDVPEFLSVGLNGATARMPDLPARATSLRLQYQLPDETYFTVATGLHGGDEVQFHGLTPYTAYTFRVLAAGPGGCTPSDTVGLNTGAKPPAAPDAPSITRTGAAELNVTMPPLPENATDMRLEYFFAGPGVTAPSPLPDTAYAPVSDGLVGGQVVPFANLAHGSTYYFRAVAVGLGGQKAGPNAQISIESATVVWTAGDPISCQGIRSPDEGVEVQAGHTIDLMSFVATDWDIKTTTVGTYVSSKKVTDPCSYTWTASLAGTPVGTALHGQKVTWTAPAETGTYRIKLVVDDQNSANSAGGTGSRNDAGLNFDDEKLEFFIDITVN